MKKTKNLLVLSSIFSSVSLFSACPNCNAGYYQNQPSGAYYQGQGGASYQNQPSGAYYQGQGGASYQNQPSGAYYQGQGGASYQNQPSGAYYQGQGGAAYYDGRQQGYQRANYSGNQSYYQDQRGQGFDNGANQGNYQGNPNQGYYNNQTADDADQMQAQPGIQRNVSDQELQKKVKDALTSWFSNDFKDVRPNINNGVVTLSGQVNTVEDKRKAEETVRKVEGVRQVNNQIIVSQPTAWNDQFADANSEVREAQKKYPNDSATTDADRQLNARIREKLGSGWFSKGYETLILRTNNGVVTISGTVESYDDIKKINNELKNVEGIRAVNNQATAKNK
jgi:osmotically-inducible protein OsmY